MTNKRRRTTRSFWLDELRRNRSAQLLRRSAERNSHRNNSSAPLSSRSYARNTNTLNAPSYTNHENSDVIFPTHQNLMQHSSDADLHRTEAHNEDGPHSSISNPSTPNKVLFQHHPLQSTATMVIADDDLPPNRMRPFDRREDEQRLNPDLEISRVQDEAEEQGPADNDSDPEPRFQPFEEEVGCRQQLFRQDFRHHSDSEDSDFSDAETIYASLHDVLQIWSSKLILSAAVAVVGSVRYTVQQYEFARDMLRDVGANPTWPSYGTTQRYFQRIIDTCMPKSKVVDLPRNNFISRYTQSNTEVNNDAEADCPDLDTARTTSRSEISNCGISKTEKVRIFFPSAWAKLDVATAPLFDDMFPAFYNDGNNLNALEFSAIVQDRTSITSTCDHIYVKSRRQQVPCGAGCKVRVSVQNQKPRLGNGFHFTVSNDSYVLEGTIVATWNVGNQGKKTSSADRVLRKQSLSPHKRAIISSLATAPPPDSLNHGDISGAIPGDLCTLMTSDHGDTEEFPVIIHRFWKYDNGIPSVMLVWMHLPRAPRPSTSAESSLRYLHTHVVDGITLVNSPSAIPDTTHPDQGTSRRNKAKSFGTLDNGMPYVVYRILLYCDDFQRSSAMYPRGSAGGCYFLPMSLPPEARRNTSSVRIISLTPPGVSTNQVLHYIVNDLVNASIRGVNGFTPTGQAVKIFIDVVGFVGDYPASSSVVDVVGHVGRNPCTVCSFRRLQDEGNQGSRYGFTTNVHANNSAFMRHGERHYSLRESDISDGNAMLLGMVIQAKYSDRTCPLLHLQRVLESRQGRSALTNEGVPVLRNTFDAFRCNFIAPDHLLTGLAKDALNAMFNAVPMNELRLKADIFICAGLRDNGLLQQKQVFNSKKKVLHSMTLSELFCVLVVSVPTFKEILRGCSSDHVSYECYQILKKLQSLVALTYWWPQHDLDGAASVKLVHVDKVAYFSDLKRLSKEYVQSVDKICSKSEVIKQYLDKPNLHRLIELYEHTIPALGHVREVMELLFESTHQPLKRCIARSNNHDAHIFAVEHCVGNDWQGRIAVSKRFLLHSDPVIRMKAKRGLRRALLGEKADLLDKDRDKDFIAKIDPILHNLFTPALDKQFQKDNMISNFAITKRSSWKGRDKIDARFLSKQMGIGENEADEVAQTSRHWIQVLYPALPDLEAGNNGNVNMFICLYGKAKRVRVSETGHQVGKPRRYDTISVNSCVQIYLDPETLSNKILVSAPYAAGARRFFFAVLAVLQRKEETPFALCFKCTKRGDYVRRTGTTDKASFHLLRLTPDIRRVAIYHACEEDERGEVACKWDEQARKVTHTKNFLGGGRFYFQTRANGYPPRIA